MSGVSELMFATTGAKQKPMLDEGSFQQLLAAAYVVQQHNDNLWAKVPQPDTAGVLSEIAEMQAMAQAGKLDLAIGAKLITERLLQIVSATGVSLSLIRDGYLDCVGESGVPAKVPGSSLASHSLVATERLKSGEVFDSADSRHDMRLDAAMCSAAGVGSLIAAPVVRFGQLAGLIEVRWARPHAFDDTGLFACRLMASLVAGILERQAAPAEQRPRPSPIPKTASNGELPSRSEVKLQVVPDRTEANTIENRTLEKNIEAVVEPETKAAEPKDAAVVSPLTARVESRETETRAPDNIAAATADITPKYPVQESGVETRIPAPATCRVCGQPFRADEVFCGRCSMPRFATNRANELQSKWASLWFIERAKGALAEKDEKPAPEIAAPAETPGTRSPMGTPLPDVPQTSSNAQPSTTETKNHFSYFEPTPFERNDADSEKQFWERAAAAAGTSKSLIQKARPKDIALLLVALILAFGVASAWPSSTGKLTWFGSIMVRMGLARHSVPTYAGNPAVKVWVDEQTSRYYCPGEDPYGKTSAGHFSSQLEAEQAQIQPASGLVCR